MSVWEASFCLGRGPASPRCQGVAHPGDLQRQAAWQGLGRHVRPSEFSGLNCSSETRTRRSGDSWNDLPKVTAQILGTGGISPGTPNLAASSRVPGAAALGDGRTPSSGLHGAHREGLGGPQGAGCGEGANQGPWPPLRSFFLLPFRTGQEATASPWHRTQENGSCGLSPPWLTLSGRAAAHLVGSQAPLLTKLWRRPAAEWLGGRPGAGAWREEREGEPSTCSVQRQQPNQGWPPPGSPRPGPQQPSRPTDMDVHTHSLTHSNHTRTHTPLLTFRPSVENTACVNSVKRSAQQESGRMSFCREAGPLGFFSIFPPIPHLDNDIRKSG